MIGHDWADKHRAVAAAADDLQTVVAELNAGHPVRVPRERALLLMDQNTQVSTLYAAANDGAMTE